MEWLADERAPCMAWPPAMKGNIMGLKDELNKVVGNVKDAVNEAKHRTDAQAEQAKRDLDGDEMTTTEKAGSMLNQTKSTFQADGDALKRDVRNES